MSQLYQAVFCGEVIAGANAGEVRKQLEELGVLERGESRDAFAGHPVVLRDGLTRDQAEKFALGLEAVDARCQILSESWLACPACRFPQEPRADCVRCGLIFAKHQERELPPVRTRREIAQDLQSAGYKKFGDEAAQR